MSQALIPITLRPPPEGQRNSVRGRSAAKNRCGVRRLAAALPSLKLASRSSNRAPHPRAVPAWDSARHASRSIQSHPRSRVCHRASRQQSQQRGSCHAPSSRAPHSCDLEVWDSARRAFRSIQSHPRPGVRRHTPGPQPRCFYCRAPLHPRQWALDHIVPRTHGGSDSPSNLVAACHSCNSPKASSPAGLFLRSPFRRRHHHAQTSPASPPTSPFPSDHAFLATRHETQIHCRFAVGD
ncbi:MAG: HNH endonuclease [Candidatus Acidiferrales bacterium]